MPHEPAAGKCQSGSANRHRQHWMDNGLFFWTIAPAFMRASPWPESVGGHGVSPIA